MAVKKTVKKTGKKLVKRTAAVEGFTKYRKIMHGKLETVLDKKERRMEKQNLGIRGGAGTGAYRGAAVNKHNENWKISGETVDYELLYGELEELRLRCRQLARDNCIAEGTDIAIRMMAIGDGPQIKSDDIEIQDFLDEAVEKIDVTGEKDMADMCHYAVSNMITSGDVLMSRVIDGKRDGIMTAFQLIEADRISTPRDLKNQRIRHGVKYDSFGRILGYFVQKIGQTETTDRYATMTSSRFNFFRRQRDGFDSAWLLKRPDAPERPAQSRQLPLFGTCLEKMKDLDDLIEAHIVGQRAAACIMGIIESNSPEEIVDAFTYDLATGEPLTDNSDERYTAMQPGAMIPLKTGEKFTGFDPKRNGNEAEPMILRLSNHIAMKTRIPYAILFLDLKSINYSSYRGGILEARKMLRRYRVYLQKNLVMPVIKLRLAEAQLIGRVNPNKILGVDFRISVQWPAFGYVDPDKEIKAENNAIAGGITSPQRAIARQGEDWREVLKEQAEYEVEKKRLEDEKGVKISISNSNAASSTPVNNQENNTDDGDDDEDEDETEGENE